MRKLIWLAIFLALAYSVYWFAGAWGVEKGMKEWASGRHDLGWQAEYTTIETHGFPVNFNTTIENPRFADPKTGVALSAEAIDIKSKSFSPTKITAQLSQQARISTPYQHIDLAHQGLSGELHVDAGPSLSIDHTAGLISDLTLSSNLGWGAALEAGKFTSQRHVKDPLTHDISVSITRLAPSSGLLSQLDPEGLLSDHFETLAVDATASFDAPWDIHALEGPRPQPRHIKITQATAIWGALQLRIAGEFDVDQRGVPTGNIVIKAENWREMIDLAASTGAIHKDMVDLSRRVGSMLAGLSGNKNTIDTELTLKNGMLVLGFIPLAPVPKIIIR